jgi:hypothetical protein
MNLLRYLILPLCLLLATGCQQYAAAPIDLTAHSRRVGSRDIITAKVTGYAEQMFARRSGATTYDPSDGLSLAEAEVVALFFNPQLRLARLRANVARVGAAEAGRWQDPRTGSGRRADHRKRSEPLGSIRIAEPYAAAVAATARDLLVNNNETETHMKKFVFSTFVALAIVSAGCDDSSHTNDTGGTSSGSTASTPSGSSASAAGTQSTGTPEGQHNRIPLGETTVGSLKLVATMHAPVKAAGGGEGAFDVVITGGKPKAVRFWVGTEDAKGSVKAKAEEETTDNWHTHAEVPSPLPPNSKFWVEVEPASGDKFVRSFDLKTQ